MRTTLLSIVIAVFLLAGCQSENNRSQRPVRADHQPGSAGKSPAKKKESLAGLNYQFAPELDKDSCTVSGGCDCCSYNVLFVDDSSFVLADYCMADRDYSKGRYVLTDTSLVLEADSLLVRVAAKELGPGPEFTYEVVRVAPRPFEAARRSCGGSMLFQTSEEYGAPDRRRTLAEEKTHLKNEGIWQMLQLR